MLIIKALHAKQKNPWLRKKTVKLIYFNCVSAIVAHYQNRQLSDDGELEFGHIGRL